MKEIDLGEYPKGVPSFVQNGEVEEITLDVESSTKQVYIPTITFSNPQNLDLGVPLRAVVDALDTYLHTQFAPVWKTTARCIIKNQPDLATWNLIFVDKLPGPEVGFVGVHRVSPQGFPIAWVSVPESNAMGVMPSFTACHELLEMLANPWGDKWMRFSPDQRVLYLKEICGANQMEVRYYGGVQVCDFNFPQWFNYKTTQTPLSYFGTITKPFQVMPGGYASVIRDNIFVVLYRSTPGAETFKPEEHPRVSDLAKGPFHRSDPTTWQQLMQYINKTKEKPKME
jgi:hypothetical protein